MPIGFWKSLSLDDKISYIGGAFYVGMVLIGLLMGFGGGCISLLWMLDQEVVYNTWVVNIWMLGLSLLAICMTAVYFLAIDHRVWMLVAGYKRKSTLQFLVFGFLAILAVWLPIFFQFTGNTYSWLIYISPVLSCVLFYIASEDLKIISD